MESSLRRAGARHGVYWMDASMTSQPTASTGDSDLRDTRLSFPPSYVLVGIHRMLRDSNINRPVFDKCRHGLRRGAIVSAAWGCFTYHIQKLFVHTFLSNTPRVTGLAGDTFFGVQLPFTLTTYATLVLLSSQITLILRFFLSKNLRISRDRAWEQAVKSRGKGPDFWSPYVEEWEVPPRIVPGSFEWYKLANGFFGRFLVKRVVLYPLNFYPFVGNIIASWLKALATAKYLHEPVRRLYRGVSLLIVGNAQQYFEAKKMTPTQITTYMEERKWDYRSFGFAAALVEGLPIIGLFFSVSNRVGAAMWAHDLEKRQHQYASGALARIKFPQEPITDGAPTMVGGWQNKKSE